jgi:hypothetical protein
MKLPVPFRQFGWRLLVSLVVIGGIYLTVHGLHRHQQQHSSSAKQQLAALRASLDENYIAGSSLHTFKRSDVLAYVALNNLFEEFKKSSDTLHKQLQTDPKLLSPASRQQLQAIVSRQQQAGDALSARLSILSQVIQYDPGTDLRGSVDSQAAILAGRARAAARGLDKAANDQTASSSTGSLNVGGANGPTLLIAPATKTALQQSIDCFNRLGQQLDSHNPATTATRTQCASSYPAMRGVAVQNVVRPVFDDEYQSYMQSIVPRLLRQLDATIRAQAH